MAGEGWNGEGTMRGLCVERMVPGREAAGGQNTLGEATDLWSRWLELPWVLGGTSGVKRRGRGT